MTCNIGGKSCVLWHSLQFFVSYDPHYKEVIVLVSFLNQAHEIYANWTADYAKTSCKIE